MKKLEGVSDIECDTKNRVATFKVTDKEYETKLAEFAKTNSHLADFTIQ